MPPVPKRRRSGNHGTPPANLIVLGAPAAALPNHVNSAAIPHVGLVAPQLDETATLLLLDMQQDNPGEVDAAMNKLYNQLSEGGAVVKERSKKRQLLLGAPSLVALSMKKLIQNENVQWRGCQWITGMMYDEGNTTDRIQAIAAAGCIEAVVNAMISFPASRRIQGAGCEGLMNIVFHIDTPIQVDINRLINAMGAVELILKAMKDFPDQDDDAIHETCCGFFANLSQKEEFRDVMMQSDVVSAVALSFDKHNAATGTYASAFMRNMFAEKDE